MEQYTQAIELWRSYSITTTADLDKYLDNFRILFAYHSGRIENEEITWHDTREIFENGKVSGFTGNPRALFKQQNQKLCYEYLREKIVANEPLSLELISEIHRILTSGTYSVNSLREFALRAADIFPLLDERRYIKNKERPGEFKKHDYVTGIHEVGSASEDVERDLTELLDELNAYKGGDTLKAGAYLHAQFEYIHPFADGNGRVGRTLLNYFLMTHSHPPLVIYDEDKASYYKSLQNYDEDEKLDSLYDFLRQQTEKTWEKTMELANGNRQKRKELSDFTQNV